MELLGVKVEMAVGSVCYRNDFTQYAHGILEHEAPSILSYIVTSSFL